MGGINLTSYSEVTLGFILGTMQALSIISLGMDMIDTIHSTKECLCQEYKREFIHRRYSILHNMLLRGYCMKKN